MFDLISNNRCPLQWLTFCIMGIKVLKHSFACKPTKCVFRNETDKKTPDYRNPSEACNLVASKPWKT